MRTLSNGLAPWILVAALAVGQAAAEDETPPFAPDPAWQVGHYAVIETDLGRVVARLLPEQAPQSVAHFAALAMGELAWTDASGVEQKYPYYDGIPIHILRAGLLFEAGDWTRTGRGAPPFYAPEEGYGPYDFSDAGRLGMTRMGGRPSAVQFFVTAAANPRFNRVFPCFGNVVEGREVVFPISQQKTFTNGRPVKDIKINSIRIFQIGTPPPLPEPRQTATGPVRLERRDMPEH
jgi:peptidyl-prolyl cis-trans isomerase A (cyclophilin A)